MSIHIRHSEQGDIPHIKAIYAQPSCYAGTLQLPFPSEQKWQTFLGNMPENFYSLVAEMENNENGGHGEAGLIVGQIGMEVFSSPRRKHVANIGMAVSESHQGQGVGDALLSAMLELAGNWLAVKRVELEVYTDNPAALHLYQKHGFVIEGTAKAYAFRNGEYTDVHLMAKVF